MNVTQDIDQLEHCTVDDVMDVLATFIDAERGTYIDPVFWGQIIEECCIEDIRLGVMWSLDFHWDTDIHRMVSLHELKVAHERLVMGL